jgi:hypothetical protein
MSLADLVSGPIASPDAGDAVLELAFLMTAVDGYLADEENEVFAAIVERIRGRAPTKEELDALLERFVAASHTVGVDERVRQVAPSVPPELRELAFKIVVGLSLVDDDESEYESALAADIEKVFALGERRAAIVKEVRAALRR